MGQETGTVAYFCPECGSASVEFSGIIGGEASCSVCQWAGAKDKLLVIKTSATTALLIESRRWDSKFDTPIQHSRNGVIVYRVDTTLGHEEGPLRLYSPRDITKYIYEEKTWPDHRCLDVFLYEGDKVTAQGFTIEVEKLSSSGDIVKIYKSK